MTLTTQPERYMIRIFPPDHDILIQLIEHRYRVSFIRALITDLYVNSCISSMAHPQEAVTHQFFPAAHHVSITGSQFIEVIVFKYYLFVAS